MFGTCVEGVDDQGLVPENLPTEELETLIQSMYQSNETIRAENDLLETYLANTDPTLIENMDSILEAATAAIHKAERTVQLGVMAAVTTRPQESTATTPRSSGQSHTPGGSSAKVAAFALSDRGPKIQPSQKMEIIQREMDLLKASFEEEKSSIDKTMFILQCKKMALTLRLREVETLLKSLDDYVTKDWIEGGSQKMSGEKMIAYFDQRIKYDSNQMKAIKTRRKNVRIQLEATNLKLKQLGEELKYVDYEKLAIEYQGAQKQLAQELENLTQIKKANNVYHVALNTARSSVKEYRHQASDKRVKIEHAERKTKSFLQEESKTLAELIEKEKQIGECVKLFKTYSAPKVIDYVEHKAKLEELREDLKAEERKKRVSQIKSKINANTAGNNKKLSTTKNNSELGLFTAPSTPN